MATRNGANGPDRESRSPTPSDGSSTKANLSISINSPRIGNNGIPVTITFDNMPVRIAANGKVVESPAGRRPEELPGPPNGLQITGANIPLQGTVKPAQLPGSPGPIPNSKEIPPSPPPQPRHIPVYYHCTPCCQICCYTPLSRASEAAARHEQEQEKKRVEEERLKQQEEARLGREALEIVRLEQELLRQRTQIHHERRRYEEKRKMWLMKLEAL